MFNENYKPTDIVPGHKALTYADMEEIGEINRQNGWGMTYEELALLGAEHLTARRNNDIHKMEYIEERLTDINFHSECGRLHNGEYYAFFIELANERNA